MKLSSEAAALILVLLSGGSNVLRDLFLYLVTGAIPQGVSCLHTACL